MHAILFASDNSFSSARPEAWQRACALMLVLLLHGAMFEAVRKGLQVATPPLLTRQIVVSLITPPAPSAPAPMPAAAAQKQALPAQPEKPRKTVAKPEHTHKTERREKPAPVSEPKPSAATPPRAPAIAANEPPAPASAPAPATAAAPAAATSAPSSSLATGKKSANIELDCYVPKPKYPPLSLRMNEEGKVRLHFLVNAQGRVEQVEIKKSSGYARLDNAARQTVLSDAVCKPKQQDGNPVQGYANLELTFSLQDAQ